MLWDRDHKKVSQENDQFFFLKKVFYSPLGKKKLATQIYIYTHTHESPCLERLASTSSRLVGLHCPPWLQSALASVFPYILGFQVLLSLVVCSQSPRWSFVISRNQVQSPYFTLVLNSLLLGLM